MILYAITDLLTKISKLYFMAISMNQRANTQAAELTDKVKTRVCTAVTYSAPSHIISRKKKVSSWEYFTLGAKDNVLLFTLTILSLKGRGGK